MLKFRVLKSEAEKGAILDLNGTYHGGLLLPNVKITDINEIPDDFSMVRMT
jgi:hypothetical protein